MSSSLGGYGVIFILIMILSFAMCYFGHKYFRFALIFGGFLTFLIFGFIKSFPDLSFISILFWGIIGVIVTLVLNEKAGIGNWGFLCGFIPWFVFDFSNKSDVPFVLYVISENLHILSKKGYMAFLGNRGTIAIGIMCLIAFYLAYTFCDCKKQLEIITTSLLGATLGVFILGLLGIEPFQSSSVAVFIGILIIGGTGIYKQIKKDDIPFSIGNFNNHQGVFAKNTNNLKNSNESFVYNNSVNLEKDNKIICAYCGEPNPANLIYCVGCNKKLLKKENIDNQNTRSEIENSNKTDEAKEDDVIERIFCCNCGQKNNTNSKYCFKCGAELAIIKEDKSKNQTN